MRKQQKPPKLPSDRLVLLQKLHNHHSLPFQEVFQVFSFRKLKMMVGCTPSFRSLSFFFDSASVPVTRGASSSSQVRFSSALSSFTAMIDCLFCLPCARHTPRSSFTRASLPLPPPPRRLPPSHQLLLPIRVLVPLLFSLHLLHHHCFLPLPWPSSVSSSAFPLPATAPSVATMIPSSSSALPPPAAPPPAAIAAILPHRP